jgi:hypothetical protein
MYPSLNKSWHVRPVTSWNINIQPTCNPLGHTRIHTMHTYTRDVDTRHPRHHLFLVLDDVGIKCINRCNADHLLTVIQQLYTVTTDWTGSLYLAMHMAWEYIHRTVDISMPGYVAKSLDHFQHHTLGCPQHPPHAWHKPKYGAHPQLTPTHNESSTLAQPALTRIQEIAGKLLFYGRAVDSTMCRLSQSPPIKQKSPKQPLKQSHNY